MSRIGRQPPPDALVHFLYTVEDLEAPGAIQSFLKRLREIVSTEHGRPFRDRFNRCVGQTRRHHRELFSDLVDWIRRDEVRDACRRAGGYAAWDACLHAFERISAEEVAHRAFGMDRPGCPRRQTLSAQDLAHALVAHQTQQGTPLSQAVDEASRLLTSALEAEGKAVLEARAIRRRGLSGVSVDVEFIRTILGAKPGD